MSLGTLGQTYNNNRFKIFRLDVEVTLTSDVRVHASRILDRVNTRAGPVDSPRWKLIEVEFTALLTELLQVQLQTDFSISSASALTYNNWKILGLANNGTAADNLDDVYSCTVIDYEDLGPENGTSQVRVKLRVEGTDG